jgi:hypothetical protein
MDDYNPDDSPNKALDVRIKKMLKKCEDEPLDVQVKVINAAISWEKVKHGINGKAEEFDPDQI